MTVNGNVIQLTEKNFDEILSKHSLILIDFSASWCAPCKDFAKVIEKVARHHLDVLFGMVDVETDKLLADEFQVRTIPAVMIMRDRVVVYAESGKLSIDDVNQLLNKAKALPTEKLTALRDEGEVGEVD